jgi:hypothetical protein
MVLRNGWLAVAIPFTIISIIALVMILKTVIRATNQGGTWDTASLTNLLCIVLVPSCLALIGWVNYFHHKR